MRQLIIALGFLAAVPAWAVDVPEGKAAVATAVLGKVTLTQVNKKPGNLAVGQALALGDEISTGPNGRVALQMATRAVLRLAPNTDLTLRPPGRRKGTFLSLAKGWVRFLVGQRAPGDAFEIRTENAVAAVKGTDGEAGFEDGVSHARVYNSEHHPALSFQDPDSGHGLDLDPGQGADYDGNLFKRLQDLKRELKESGERYGQLPPPDLGEKGAPDDPSQAGKDAGPTHNVGLEEALDEALHEVGRDLKADGTQENSDRSSDLAAGRVAVDRFGVQVQISNYVQRPASNQVVLSTYTRRVSGPQAGVSFATQATTWNSALPDDWSAVARRAVNDPANVSLDVNGSPVAQYYRVLETMVLGDSLSDRLQMVTEWSAPFLDPGSTLQQAYSQDLWAYGPGAPSGAELFYTLYSASSSLGSQAADQSLLQNQTSVATAYPYSSNYFYTSTAGLDGGASVTYDLSSFQASYSLVQTFHVLNSQGAVQTLPGVDPGIINGTYYGTVFPSDFKGLDSALTLELSYDVPGLFAQPIDLVVMPAVYDQMEGLQPFLAQPGNSCRGGC